jgi:ribonuclease P protein component
MASPSSGSNGLPKTARLRTPREFQRVQTSGRSFDLGPLVFRVLPLPSSAAPTEGAGRLGLAISKRVGNSVQRNWVKRRVRECFRLRKRSLGGYDLVVTGRPAAATLETADVDRLFEQLLQRLGRESRRG